MPSRRLQFIFFLQLNNKPQRVTHKALVGLKEIKI